MPTLRHLQIFVEVANCGKMSVAAKNLYLSQPTISQLVADLESHYNVLLFERLTKKLHLTEAGEELYRQAGDVLLAFNTLEDRMKETTQQYVLRIGASATAGTFYLNRIIDRINQKVPNFNVKVYVYTTSFIIEELVNNNMDIALVEFEIKRKEIVVVPVFTDKLILVCGRGHPFYDNPHIVTADLQDHSFVLRERSSGSREILLDFLSRNNIQYRGDWWCNSVSAQVEATTNNRGLSMLSESLVQTELANGTLREVNIEGVSFNRKVSAAYHQDKHFSKAMKTFIEACREMEKEPDT